MIPTIRASARIVKDVDPYSSEVYQKALTQGVAHALGTGTPGGNRNIFLFSHSSVNFYEASRYNSVFYLLHRLEPGDPIEIYYRGEKYVYLVSDKKIVEAEAVSYLTNPLPSETLTLMTCWPPGTTLKRLVIQASPLPLD